MDVLTARLTAFRYVLEEERSDWANLISKEFNELREEVITKLDTISSFKLEQLSPTQVRLYLPPDSIELRQYILSLERYKSEHGTLLSKLNDLTQFSNDSSNKLEEFRSKHHLLLNRTVALEREVERHKRAEERYEQKIKSLSSNAMKLVAGLPKQRITELEEELKSNSEYIKKIEKEFSGMCCLVQEKTNLVRDLEEKNSSLISSKLSLENELESTRKELNASEGRISEVSDINLKLIKENADLNDKTGELNEMIQNLSNDNQILNKELSQLKSRSESFEEKLSELSSENTFLLDELNHANTSLSQLKAESETCLMTSADVESRLQSINFDRSQVDQFKQQVSSLKKEVKQKTTLAKKNGGKVVNLEKQIADLESKLDSEKEMTFDLKEKLDIVNHELEIYKREVNNLELNNEELSEMLSKSRVEVTSINIRSKELDSENKELKNENLKLSDNLTLLQSNYNSLVSRENALKFALKHLEAELGSPKTLFFAELNTNLEKQLMGANDYYSKQVVLIEDQKESIAELSSVNQKIMAQNHTLINNQMTDRSTIKQLQSAATGLERKLELFLTNKSNNQNSNQQSQPVRNTLTLQEITSSNVLNSLLNTCSELKKEDSIETALITLNYTMVSLQDQLVNQQNNESYEMMVFKMKESLEGAEVAISSLSNKLSVADELNSMLENDLNSMKLEHKRLLDHLYSRFKKTVAQYSSKFNEVSHSNFELLRENYRLTNIFEMSMHDVNSGIDLSSSQFDLLKRVFAEFNELSTVLSSNDAIRKQNIAKFSRSIHRLEAENKQLREEITSLTDRNTASTSLHEHRAGLLKTLRINYRSLQADFDTLKQEQAWLVRENERLLGEKAQFDDLFLRIIRKSHGSIQGLLEELKALRQKFCTDKHN
ncbi:hypothetical protein P9112_012508 [Eukaryota sp. TZLM1-RC]